MSSVLRPQYGNFKRKSEVESTVHTQEELIPFVASLPSLELENSLPVIQRDESFVPYKEIIVEETEKKEKGVESVNEETVVHVLSQTTEIPLVAKNISEDEKISEALEKILERKIEKAITSAEVELDTLKTKHVGEEVKVATEESVMDGVAADISEVVHGEMIPNSPTATPVVDNETQSIPIQVPVVSTSNNIPLIKIGQDPRTFQNEIANPVPVHVDEVPSVSEVIPATTEQASPVIQSIFSPKPQEEAPKIHWFDKLFGSTPKTPPQTV